MANYNETQILVALKSYSRANPLAIDSSSVWESCADAEKYAISATAYGGQVITALLDDGKYHPYVLQPSEAGYTLEEVGAVTASDLKQYVQMPTELPETGEQGILYIVGTTGSIWDGTGWKTVFYDVSVDLDLKANIASPNFTGTVTVNDEEVAVKSYVEGLIANITSSAPGIVDSSNALPSSDYKAGQTFRVAEAGTYAGAKCEVGDLIMVVSDYNADTASNSDFMVVQANIDGAVTSSADTATVGEIVVFDAVTGKVVKGSGVNISSLNDVISKAHEHSNKTQLDSYDKTQAELLEAAKTEAQTIADTLSLSVDGKLDLKANKSDVENSLTIITENLNTKVTASEVDTKIATAKEEIEDSYTSYIDEKIGDLGESTDVVTFVNNAVGSGGTASATAIATAKQEAINTSKEYTDSQIGDLGDSTDVIAYINEALSIKTF